VVVLLRGVNNIGSVQRIAMADLRTLVEDLGFRDVRTLLNSGNIVLSVPNRSRGNVAGRIEEALHSKFGINSRATAISQAEVAAAVRDNPLAGVAGNPSSLLVMVPRKASDRNRLEPLLRKPWHPEALAVGERVAYLWCANGVAESRLWPAVDRALERTGTARNMATMTKLLALVKVDLAPERRGRRAAT
jgi:uncharacterized protein (DUF1697 family)